MKYHYYYLTILLCFTLFAHSQVRYELYKEFDADTFKIGDKIVLPYIKMVRFCNVLSDEAKDSLQVVVNFLQLHPSYTIEVGAHSDSRGSEAFNLRCTKSGITSIKTYLATLLGKDSVRVNYKAYGEAEILIRDVIINMGKTELLREKMHAINRRTELKIISVE